MINGCISTCIKKNTATNQEWRLTIRAWNHEDEIGILNFYKPAHIVSGYIKQKHVEQKHVGYVSLTHMSLTEERKLSRGRKDLHISDEIDLTDMLICIASTLENSFFEIILHKSYNKIFVIDGASLCLCSISKAAQGVCHTRLSSPNLFSAVLWNPGGFSILYYLQAQQESSGFPCKLPALS